MIRNLVVTALIWVGLASGAVAQGGELWKKSGNWEILIDAVYPGGCSATVSWTSGTRIYIGTNPNQVNGFFVMVGNDKWSSLRPNQEYEIGMKFDRSTPWDVSATGFQFDGSGPVYLRALSSKDSFIREFRAKNRLAIFYQGQEIDALSLVGSSRAYKEVVRCQTEVNKRGTTTDPFAGSSPGPSTGSSTGRKSADPFATN
jgi:hypothetical protein